MKYRPEIDGLRAVAVLPVILFHAGVSAFSGGFVGVDVFFCYQWIPDNNDHPLGNGTRNFFAHQLLRTAGKAHFTRSFHSYAGFTSFCVALVDSK